MSARTKTVWTFVITSIALFMVTLDNLVVSTAIPVIREDLNASLESLEWTVNAYTLTFAVLLLTGAALGDRFGRRRVFAIGIGVFTLGSVAAALAPNVEMLNLARAVQGLGGAIVLPLTLTILSAAVPRRSAGSRSAPGAGSAASRSRSARSSAARSCRASRGSGSSGSTCRSASPDPARALAPAGDARAGGKLDLPGSGSPAPACSGSSGA